MLLGARQDAGLGESRTVPGAFLIFAGDYGDCQRTFPQQGRM